MGLLHETTHPGLKPKISEGKIGSLPTKNGPISRREFIKTALVGAATLAVGALAIDAEGAHREGRWTRFSRLWEFLETGFPPAISDIETHYGISMVNPTEAIPITDPSLPTTLGENVVSNLKNANPDGKICSWDAPRLVVLDEVLKELPPGFYSSPQKPMKFILWEGEGMARRKVGESDAFRGHCECDAKKKTDGFPPAVAFVKRDLRTFYSYDRMAAKQLIVHELTHQKTLSEENYDDSGKNTTIDACMAAIGLPSTELYGFLDPQLVELFKNHLNFFGGAEGRGGLKPYPKEDDLLGTSIRPQEFIANAGQYYFLGHQEFTKTFTPDLGEQRTEALYQFVKDHVFEGYEYVNGQKFTPTQKMYASRK